MKNFLRRLRGALGNAMVWGTAWFGAGFALWTAFYLLGQPLPGDPWRVIPYVAANFGVAGFLAGGAFSAFLRVAYRDRPILEIKVGRFALGGAVIAGLLFPTVTMLARMSIGTGMSLGDLLATGLMAAFFGGVTAGGTIKLAQRTTRKLSGAAIDELETEQDEVLALLRDHGVSQDI